MKTKNLGQLFVIAIVSSILVAILFSLLTLVDTHSSFLVISLVLLFGLGIIAILIALFDLGLAIYLSVIYKQYKKGIILLLAAGIALIPILYGSYLSHKQNKEKQKVIEQQNLINKKYEQDSEHITNKLKIIYDSLERELSEPQKITRVDNTFFFTQGWYRFQPLNHPEMIDTQKQDMEQFVQSIVGGTVIIKLPPFSQFVGNYDLLPGGDIGVLRVDIYKNGVRLNNRFK
jgi:hypothetical protein